MNIKVDNLGEYLKGKRNVKGVTVRDVSYETGLSPGYISRMDDSFDIFDILSDFNWKINGKKLSKNEKDNISNIIKLIYDISWDNDVDKTKGINELFAHISKIKQLG